MRSPAVRLMVGATAWLALAAAAFFLITSERDIQSLSGRVRAFDLHAREVSDALSELRAAQQAYVAAGQGVAFWMPKVATTIEAIRAAIASLRESAASDAARSALMQAEATIAEFDTVDRRARDYIKSGDQLMAADVIFAEGGDTAATAARQVERARLGEHQALDASEAAIRKRQAIAAAAGGGVVALAVLLLIPVRQPAALESAAVAQPQHVVATPPPPVRPSFASARTVPILRTAADLCTDFGRIRDVEDLNRMLGRAAEVLDASGVVVWVGNTSGGDLHPVASCGYPPQVAARMPAVSRSADNAAAAAYRSGMLQIVLSRPGGAAGALVAPILTADGCIGALSAEIRGGGEGAESVQALTTIFASQLAAIVGPPGAEPRPAVEPKTAAQA